MRGKPLTILLAATLAGSVAFFAGGVVGFGRGYNAALFAESSGAASTVLMLRKLHEGDSKPALNLLELQLDSQIVDNSVGRKGFESIFNLPRLVGFGDTQAVDRSARTALKYRAEVPSPVPPPAKAEIDAALADLARREAGSH
jgi:hypothetical protein